MREAAEAMRLTAEDLRRLGVTDRIIKEPKGGAHRDGAAAIQSVHNTVASLLKELEGKDAATLVADRRRKYLDMGSKGLAA